MAIVFQKDYAGMPCDFTLFALQATSHSEPKLIGIFFQNQDNRDLLSYFRRYIKDFECLTLNGPHGFLDFCACALYRYFSGKSLEVDVPYLLLGTEYQQSILEQTKAIPYGTLLTFEALSIPIKKGSLALLHNPLPIIFPCHRLNARAGETTAYCGGIPLKRKLLNLEYETKTGGNAIKSANELLFDYDAYEASLPNDAQFPALLEHAKLHNIPITKPESIAFIKSLCALKMPQTALEIGTATGYSALSLAPFVKKTLWTMERDVARADLAAIHFQMYNTPQIQLLTGDAIALLDNFPHKLDFVYIDAAKGQNYTFFDKLLPLLQPHALLIFDNCMYKGLVFQDETVKHKARSMVKKMQAFVSMALVHPDFQSSLSPIGDGLLTMVRKY